MKAHRIVAVIPAVAAIALANPALAATRVATPSNINSVLSQARAGDVISLSDGTYNNVQINTELDNLTITAANVGKAIFSGSSYIHFGGNNVRVQGMVFRNGGVSVPVITFRSNGNKNATNSTVSGIVIDNYNTGVSSSLSMPWVQFNGSGNTLSYSAFYRKTNKHAFVHVPHASSSAVNQTVKNNWMGFRTPAGNDNHCLGVGSGGQPNVNSGVLILRNYLENCDGEAEAMSIKAAGVTIKENVLANSLGAIVLRNSANSTVDRNVIFGRKKAGTSGIRAYGNNHRITNNYIGQVRNFAISLGANGTGYIAVTNATVSNNTIVDYSSFGIGAGTSTSGMSGIALSNNLFAKPSGGVTPSESNAGSSVYRAIGSRSVGFDSALRDVAQFTGSVSWLTTNGMYYPSATGLSGAGAPLSTMIVMNRNDYGSSSTRRVGPYWYTKPTS